MKKTTILAGAAMIGIGAAAAIAMRGRAGSNLWGTPMDPSDPNYAQLIPNTAWWQFEEYRTSIMVVKVQIDQGNMHSGDYLSVQTDTEDLTPQLQILLTAGIINAQQVSTLQGQFLFAPDVAITVRTDFEENKVKPTLHYYKAPIQAVMTVQLSSAQDLLNIATYEFTNGNMSEAQFIKVKKWVEWGLQNGY